MTWLERIWAWFGDKIPPEFHDFWDDDEETD
jgi:hypothetical protein